MKKLFALLAVLALFAPAPAAASCHVRFTFDVVGPNPDDPKRVGIGENITFKTKFQIDPGARSPCDRELFEIQWNELRGAGLSSYEIRVRQYARDRHIFPGREVNADFSIPAEGETGRRWYTVAVTALSEGGFGGAGPEVIASAMDRDLLVIEGITERELTENEKQGIAVPQARPVPLGVRIGDYVEAANLAQYVGVLFNYLTRLLILISTVMVIAGGFSWLMAGGAPDKITAAKKRITNAIVGLAIGLSTLMLLGLINPALIELKELKIPQVVQQKLYDCENGTLGCVCRAALEDNVECNRGLFCVEDTKYFLARENGGVWDNLTFYASEGVSNAAFYGAAGAVGGSIIPGLGTGIGAAGGVVFGFAVGVGQGIWGTLVERQEIAVCSDGKLGSPCKEGERQCVAGLTCAKGVGVCIPSSGNAAGTLCNTNESNCAGGLACEEVGDTGMCRGTGAWRSECHNDLECATDLRCVKAVGTDKGRCGSNARIGASAERRPSRNGDPCVIGRGNYGTCLGPDNPVCAYCPAPGNRRVWTPLTFSVPNAEKVLGSCKPQSSINQGCTD